MEVLPVYAPPGVFFGTIIPQGSFDLALYTLFAAPEAGITTETSRRGGSENVTGGPQG